MECTGVPVLTGDILIADDRPANLQLLSQILVDAGYAVRPASNGRLALQAVHAKPPDLILLDVKMPGMDGFEVCRHLKAADRSREIPVVFVSALDEVVNKVHGFEVGGVDYITKPFEPGEVLARVRTHLALRGVQAELRQRNTELLAANSQLTQEVEERQRAEAALQTAKDELENRVHQRTSELEDAVTRLQSEAKVRQQAEETLRHSEQRVRTLVTNIPGMLYRCDPLYPWRMGYLSDGASTLTGYPNEDILDGNTLDYGEIVLADDHENLARVVAEAIAAHGSFACEYRICRADETVRWVHECGRAAYDEHDNPLWLDGVIMDITDRKRVEETLRENEAKYRSLVESIPDVVWTIDSTGRTIFISPNVERICGYSPEEIRAGRSAIWLERICPKDRPFVEAAYRALFAEGAAYDVEYRIKHNDGRWIWLHDRANMIVERDGQFHAHGVFSDITDRIQAEETLRESEERFRIAAQSTSDLIFEWIVATDELKWFGDIDAALGYAKDEFSHTLEAWLHSIHPDDAERMAAEANHFQATGDPVCTEYRIRAKDGEWRYWMDQGLAILNDTGKACRLIGACTDVTEQKRAEEAVRRSEERYRQLSDLTFEGIVLHYKGVAVDVNQSYARMFGYTREELIGKNLLELNVPEQHHATVLGRLTQDDTGPYEIEGRRKDGTTFPMEVEARETGPDSPRVSAVRDITERKRAEEHRNRLIEELETRNAELERFAYAVSHDLKTPLITISWLLGALGQDLAEGNIDDAREDAGRICNASETMASLLDNVLEIARVGRVLGKRETVSLGELVTEVLALLESQIVERRVHVTISTGNHTFQADRTRMREVLQNLVENAAKFMGTQPDPHVEIGVRQDDQETVCFVRDNGIGVDPPYQDRIFGLFDQLEQGISGSGVGLALAKRIIEVHGGRIWIESEGTGQGSTFCFTIPDESDDGKDGEAEGMARTMPPI